MHTHEDLIGNRGTNPGEIPGNGRDDDGNGYVVGFFVVTPCLLGPVGPGQGGTSGAASLVVSAGPSAQGAGGLTGDAASAPPAGSTAEA